MRLISQLQHVSLMIDDVEATRAFYRDVMGFRELVRADFGPAAPPGLWFELDNGQMVHLTERRDDPALRLVHVAYEVDDLEQAATVVTGRGVAIERARHVPRAGYQFYVADPSGNLIEFNQRDT